MKNKEHIIICNNINGIAGMMPSEASQWQMLYDLMYTWNLKKKKKNPTKNPSKWQKRKSDLQVSEAGVGGGGDWSKMSKGYKLSDVKVVITMWWLQWPLLYDAPYERSESNSKNSHHKETFFFFSF